MGVKFFMALLFMIFTTVNSVVIDLNLCDDWITYNKEKCFKVIPIRLDKSGAESACTKLDPKASLLTIASSVEQEFVNKIMANYSQFTDKVWTGMTNTVAATETYSNWVDETPYEYSTQVYVTGRYSNYQTFNMPFCVQMSVNVNFMGKWYSEPCGRRAYAVCQKSQVWTLTILSTALENVTMLVNSQQARINELERNVSQTQLNKANTDKPNGVQNDVAYNDNLRSIPIGFVYIQLRNQSEPIHLWPQFKWTDITNEYKDVVSSNAIDNNMIEMHKVIERWELNKNSTTGPDLREQMDGVELTKDVLTPQTNHTVKHRSGQNSKTIWKRIA